MKKQVKYLLLMALWIALCMVSLGFQPGTEPAPTATVPPWWAFVAMLLGIFTHWYSEYREGQYDLSFPQYLMSAVGKTISMIVGCLALLGATWMSNPATFVPFSLGGLITAWTIGWTADSALNGVAKGTPSAKPLNTAAPTSP